MAKNVYTLTENYADFETDFSKERLETYLNWSDNNLVEACKLYGFNSFISSSLYIPLQSIEVILRNRIDIVMKEKIDENWLKEYNMWVDDERYNFNVIDKNGHTENKQKRYIKQAISSASKNHGNVTHGHIIAELNFGFWTSLLGRRQEDLWQTILHKIIIRHRKNLSRSDVSDKLDSIRNLRNRIFHYEPIIHLKGFNEKVQYNNIIFLLERISLSGVDFCEMTGFFDKLFQDAKNKLDLIQQKIHP